MCRNELRIELTGFVGCLRLCIDRVQRKSGLARDVELADRQRVHLLHSLILIGTPLQLLETFGNVKRDVDEHPVDLRLNFVGSEENVGFEVVNRLKDLLRVNLQLQNIKSQKIIKTRLVNNVLLQIHRTWCRSSELGSQRKDRHVRDRLLVVLDLRVIRLKVMFSWM